MSIALTVMPTVEECLSLLGVESLPGNDESAHDGCRRWICHLLEVDGEAWIKKNRQALLSQLDYILSRRPAEQTMA